MLATLYDLTIRWASSRRAPFFLALISFTESSFLPIPPDVMLAPMSMANPKLAWRYAAIATIFSVIGGIFGYFLGFLIFDPIIYPLIIKFGYYEAYNTMLHWFNLRGFWAVVLAGFTPIPYKMFTIGAGVLKFSLSGFIVASMLGRGIRFFLVSSLMRFGGNKIELFCRNLFSKYGKIIAIIGVGLMLWALCSCSYTDYNLYNSKPNKYHIVRSGETLYSIAKENDIEVERMAKLNHLKFPYIITSGQRLILPTFSYYTYLKEQENRHKQLKEQQAQNKPFFSSNKETAKNFIANYVGLKNQKKSLEKPKESLATRTAQNRQEDVSDLQSVPFERTPVKRETTQKIKLSSSSATLAHKDWSWPAKGKIINKFGIKEPKANKGINNKSINNKGIDIFGKKGDPIKAIANGTVVYSGSNLPGYGNVIIIKHNQDFLSVYAQNEEILVTEQQEVKQGQQIATMGDGDTKKSLLHFEIRYKGKPVDPIKILAQKEN